MPLGFVLDASVAISWCLEDEGDSYSVSVLEALSRVGAAAPAIWPLEMANSLLMAERRKRLTAEGLPEVLRMLNTLPVLCDSASTNDILFRVHALARAQGLSVYDASYLDLAMRRGLPIASRDATLLKAAKKCGVAMFKPT